MMLLLLSTLCGWTQPLKKWTISKENNDTIIAYNFTKQEFVNLRVYITELERESELYKINEKELIIKDSIIQTQKYQIINKDSIIQFKDTVITIQNIDFQKLDKWAKEQEALKIKYKKQADAWPYWLGAGSAIGTILCLLLNR